MLVPRSNGRLFLEFELLPTCSHIAKLYLTETIIILKE